jgi:hypothetical protein
MSPAGRDTFRRRRMLAVGLCTRGFVESNVCARGYALGADNLCAKGVRDWKPRPPCAGRVATVSDGRERGEHVVEADQLPRHSASQSGWLSEPEIGCREERGGRRT